VPIRVLIVDDSAFMRAALSRVIGSDARFTVVGMAKDGLEAVEQARALRPDVITMDYNMPRMNGAEATSAILADRPVPVVMLSAHTQKGAAETLNALSAGAVDFLTKPDGEVSVDLSAIRDVLLQKLQAASRARPMIGAPDSGTPGRVSRVSLTETAAERTSRTTLELPSRPSTPPSDRTSAERISFASLIDPLVVIAVSTGGPAALERVIPALDAGFPSAVLVVQHMPGQFTRALADRLDRLSRLDVREARDQDRPAAGTVLIAPGDHHLVVERGGRVRLQQSAPVNGCRPSADVTLQSAAPVYGERLTAVVMTGMGKDGAIGAAAVAAAGGRVLAQDRETSVIFGMPRAAIEMGVVSEVLPLDQIAPALQRSRT
jgi:two-component system chemotaxis response regulator CheB